MIKCKTIVVYILLVIRAFIKTQLKVVYHPFYFPFIVVSYLPLPVPNYPRLEEKAYKTRVSYMAIIHGYTVCMYARSDNLEKFLKLCVKSNVSIKRDRHSGQEQNMFTVNDLPAVVSLSKIRVASNIGLI